MKRIIGIIVVGLFSTIYSQAQSAFVNGFLIQKNGDTLRGSLDLAKNTVVSKITFKNSIGEIKSFTPVNIKGFGYYNGLYYESFAGRQDFMEVLSAGKIKLLNSGGNFFCFVADSLIALENTERKFDKDGQPYLKDGKEYIGMLNLLFADCPKIKSRINQVELSQRSLQRIFKLYGECKGEVQKPLTKVKQPSIIGFGVSIYQSNNSVSKFGTEQPIRLTNIQGFFIENLTDLLKIGDIKQYNALTYGLVFSAMNPRVSRHVGLTIEGLYNEFKMSSASVYYSFGNFVRTNYTSFSLRSLHIQVQAQYHFRHLNKKINPFLSVGVGTSHYNQDQGSYSVNNFSSNGIEYTNGAVVNPVRVQSFGYTLIGGAGIKINYLKRLQGQFNLKYEYGSGPFIFTEFGGTETVSHQDSYYAGSSIIYLIGKI